MKTDRDVLVELLKGSTLTIDVSPKQVFLTGGRSIHNVELLGKNVKHYKVQTVRPKTFPERLTHYRRLRRFTIEGLATKAGLSHQVVARYGTGDHEPKLCNLAKLCKALNVSSIELLGF